MKKELQQRLKAIVERNSRVSLSRKRLIKKFANNLGLIYFGTVDQHTDDHRVVRGFSTSSTHKDDSYTVGEFQDYAVTLVDRFDVHHESDGTIEKHRWLIAEIDLIIAKDIPHIFLLPTHQSQIHYHKLFQAFSKLEPITEVSGYSPDFLSRYTPYSPIATSIEVEKYMTFEATRTIAAHFWPYAVEIFEGSVYVYDAEQALTTHTLEQVVKNGVWLAQVIDSIN